MTDQEHEAGSNDVLPIQPRPILTRVVHYRFLTWTITAIMRHWRPGDSGPDGRCRLCPQCRAHGDGCLVVVGFKVPKVSASLFSGLRLPWQRPLVARDEAATIGVPRE